MTSPMTSAHRTFRELQRVKSNRLAVSCVPTYCSDVEEVVEDVIEAEVMEDRNESVEDPEESVDFISGQLKKNKCLQKLEFSNF